MKAKVSTLYRNGKALPQNKIGKIIVGSLTLATVKSAFSGNLTTGAWVQNKANEFALPSMENVVCESISADGFRLRGTENINGREVYQEWWCRPIFGGNEMNHKTDTETLANALDVISKINIKDYENKFREVVSKSADRLRELDAETDLRAEPDPNGTIAARVNWWKRCCDDLQNSTYHGNKLKIE